MDCARGLCIVSGMSAYVTGGAMLTRPRAAEHCVAGATWQSALASSLTRRESFTSIRTMDLKFCDGISIEIGSRYLPMDWPVESGSRSANDVTTSAYCETLCSDKLATECRLDDDGLGVDGGSVVGSSLVASHGAASLPK